MPPRLQEYKLGLCYKIKTIAAIQKKEKEGITREISPHVAETKASDTCGRSNQQ
jgi:hypothetical protein